MILQQVFTLDATTSISIDGSDNSNITVTGSGKNLTLAAAGGSTQVLSVNSAGTGANAIDINATAGGIDIDATMVFSLDATTISIDGTDDSNVTVTNSGKNLILTGVAGGGTQVLWW